jgi:hypothetical protein
MEPHDIDFHHGATEFHGQHCRTSFQKDFCALASLIGVQSRRYQGVFTLFFIIHCQFRKCCAFREVLPVKKVCQQSQYKTKNYKKYLKYSIEALVAFLLGLLFSRAFIR